LLPKAIQAILIDLNSAASSKMSLIKMEMIRSDEAESYFNRLRNAIEV
jgi:hypothetical protein